MNPALSRDAYQELLCHTVDAITVLDDDSYIEYVSPAVTHILGYDPEDLIGEDVFRYIHPDDRGRVRETFDAVVAAGGDAQPPDVECRVRHSDGSWVWFENRACDESPSALDGYVVSSRDITDRKEAEQHLQREQQRVDRFASFVSHDIRNPLNVAQGHLELGREQADNEHFEAVAASLNRMDELIEDVLTVVQASETDLVLDAVALRTIAEECWTHVDTEGATLAVETDQQLVADDRHLKLLLENLFRNAIEHGGAEVTITIGALADGFYVADDGQGFPDEDREMLMDYGVSRSRNGTGLGLSIVQAVADRHGWSLQLADSDDDGARIELTDVELVE